MRRWPLLLLLFAAPALSQPVPPPPAAAPAAAPPPKAPAPRPTTDEEDTREFVKNDARRLMEFLLTGDARSVAGRVGYPFQLEEKRFDTPELLVAAWVRELRARRTDLVTLYDIEVLPYAELEKKYGKPPARLGPILPRGVEVYAAVANLSGHAALLLYRKADEGWKAFAYTD